MKLIYGNYFQRINTYSDIRGRRKLKHFEEGFVKGNADAVCTSNIYHFTETSINSAKKYLKSKNISIRT